MQVITASHFLFASMTKVSPEFNFTKSNKMIESFSNLDGTELANIYTNKRLANTRN